ncbi:cell division protein FtsL [bacterium]|nr:cell division protein FtsL [bacterium]
MDKEQGKKSKKNAGKMQQNESAQINPDIVQKVKDKSKKHKRRIVFCYSFLTFVLLFCLVQVGVSVILNTSKTIAYRGKIKTMTRVRDEAEQRNKDLKNDIKLFSKSSSLEEIARNNLKMAGDNEVLVIINNPPPEQDKKKKKQKKDK